MVDLNIFTPALISVGCFVTLLFIVSVIIKRNDIADVAWGPGIALAAWSTALWSSNDLTPPMLIVLALISIWAVRLGWRIGRKNIRKGAEDPRYKRWRESWGKTFYLRSYVQVFLLQGFLMIVLASSFIGLSVSSGHTTSVAVLSAVVLMWLVGFFFEVIGDSQLDHFLKQPENKGELMRYGLWRYSRHPNYFGEITMWWAIAGITLFAGAPLWVLISPITITLLIVYVSGIPLLEAHFENHPEWAEYKRITSVLVPWFVKR